MGICGKGCVSQNNMYVWAQAYNIIELYHIMITLHNFPATAGIPTYVVYEETHRALYKPTHVHGQEPVSSQLLPNGILCCR